jgi:hypothetical protein
VTEARLIVDGSSIAFRPSGPATGDIALLVDGTPFPLAGWNDFVVVIVEAWISALLRLLQGASETERVHFMEGPYAVDIGPLAGDSLRLRAFERPNREHTLVVVRSLTLVESAIKAAEEVLKVCSDARDRSRDTDRLVTALDALRKEASRMSN